MAYEKDIKKKKEYYTTRAKSYVFRVRGSLSLRTSINAMDD